MYPSGDMEGEFLAAPLASPVEAVAWLSGEALLKLLEGTDASDAAAEGSAVLAWPGPPNIYNHNKRPTTCPSQKKFILLGCHPLQFKTSTQIMSIHCQTTWQPPLLMAVAAPSLQVAQLANALQVVLGLLFYTGL